MVNPDQADDDEDTFGNVCDNNDDQDRDGIPDINDNCPTIPNADQLDTDNDKMGDECDDDADGDGILNVGIFYCFSATQDTATYSFIATADTWRPSGGGAVSGPASKLQFWQHSLLLYFVDQECILHVIIADTFAKEMQ